MADTHLHVDLDLSPSLAAHVEAALSSGPYPEAKDFVIDLIRRDRDTRAQKLDRLRAHIAEGIRQADAGEFVQDFCVERFLEEERQSDHPEGA